MDTPLSVRTHMLPSTDRNARTRSVRASVGSSLLLTQIPGNWPTVKDRAIRQQGSPTASSTLMSASAYPTPVPSEDSARVSSAPAYGRSRQMTLVRST
ncbi:hypothetical protein OH77DRAFT_1301248 [Trametes cingulata]|nr:hypothetical protein OH77DRAFT_1301248 [Trametes cingulata]